MRRCLRAFLVGLITLSLVSGPAHACWRSRRARNCRPVVVACPPPAWNACSDPCGEPLVVVASPCQPAPVCCGEGAVVSDHMLVDEGVVVAEGIVVGEPSDTVVETVIDTSAAPTPVVDSQPTPAPEAGRPVAVAEPPAAGLAPTTTPPSLAPAGETGGVQTTSVEQPLSLSAGATPAAEPPGGTATAESVLADEAEMQQPAEAEAVAPAPAPAEPVAPAEPPAADATAAPEADEPAAEEPEMTTDEPLPGDEPIPADEPSADAEPPAEPPMEEDVVPEVPEPAEPEPTEPEPTEPEPAMEPTEPAPEAAPEEGNIFEELEAEEGVAAPAADEGEMTEEPAAVPEGDSEPADPFAEREPARRWIDASGTASMVATLIEVGADGRCVLETRGRRIAVPVENLSGHDRDYVREAGVRLAKSRATRAGETAAAAPAPTDTAGL